MRVCVALVSAVLFFSQVQGSTNSGTFRCSPVTPHPGPHGSYHRHREVPNTPLASYPVACSSQAHAHSSLLCSLPSPLSITHRPRQPPHSPTPPTFRDPIHRTVPIAKNIAVAATAGTNLELRLRGYDLDGDALTYKVTSLPSHGSLIQLSHNYDYYGYDPKEGNALATAGTTVTGSNARVIFSPPADGKGALSLGKWGEFLYEVTDGAAQSEVGKVTFNFIKIQMMVNFIVFNIKYSNFTLE